MAARALALLAAAALFACAPSPAWRDGRATFEHRGVRFERSEVRGESFLHAVFTKVSCRGAEHEAPLVFLDGDGNSWIRDGRVPADPTPTRAIALDLLAADARCGVYVARACTFGLARRDPACEPSVWTVGRYEERVIRDLAAAIERAVAPEQPILLVGYSGGGLLAAHLAARMPRVQGLLTVAANLDVEAWARHHGFTPALAERAPPAPFPLRNDLAQWHVFGERDAIAPAALSRSLLARDANATLYVVPDADHSCCWIEAWPDLRAAFALRQ